MNIFTKHPTNVGETYLIHMKHAAIFGARMLIGGLCCFIHAIFPFLFERTASRYLMKMANDYIDRMPKIDQNVMMLSELLQRKIAQHGHNQRKENHGSHAKTEPNRS